jgi:hypothetical protein
MQLSPLLVRFTRYPQDAERGSFAAHVPQQQRQQSLDIQTIRLRTTCATIHLDTR